ncbi:hypothetical protein [Streptomyces sp. NBC_01465]|uniref:hypothetical protein n=1 Tax=Streptomyces sp. NBC_01465 TaxID=2903878 RepID=UPI002E372233|nr:hypothetical protein [Streptomyces sp. NBC_01465]
MNLTHLHIRTVAALACAATLVTLSACGGSKKPAADHKPKSRSLSESRPGARPNGIEKLAADAIYNTATHANAEAGSLRERMARPGITSDLRLSPTECAGTVTRSAEGSYEIVRKGTDTWVKPSARFAAWMTRSTGTAFSDSAWLHGTAGNPVTSALSSYCHSEQFAAPDASAGGLTKGRVSQLDGLQVTSLARKGAGGKSVTYYIASTGTPNLIMQDVTGSRTSPDLTYSDFGKPVGAKKPTGKIVEAPKD